LIDPNAPVTRVPVTEGSNLVLPVVLTNTGKTPAFDVTGSAILTLLPMGTVPEFVYTPGHHRTVVKVETMYPGSNTNEIPVILFEPTKDLKAANLTETQVRGIKAGTLTMTVHGRIEYRDVFDIHHWFTFCYQPDLGGATINGRPVTVHQNQLQACLDY